MLKILQASLQQQQQQKMHSRCSQINLRSALTVIFHTPPFIPHQIPSLQNTVLNKQLSLVLPLLSSRSKLSSSLISYC